MIRIGMLGLSDGNGHPFSFSAIINGYDPERLLAAGWAPINAYLDLRDPADLGFPHAQVTHAWCPDPLDTRALCEATHIPNAVDSPDDLLGAVDAIVLARDDWGSHWPIAKPFLDADMPVFVDKPLTLDAEELATFRPYLDRGRLMSCSGYRFAPELDGLRPALREQPPLVMQGIGPQEWERYAIHLLEPLLGLTSAQPTGVHRPRTDHDAAVVSFDDGALAEIHCLGDTAPGFFLNVTTATSRYEVSLADRFTGFRRMLEHFVRMVETGVPPVDPAATMVVHEILMQGRTTPTERRP